MGEERRGILGSSFMRSSPFLTHQVFNRFVWFPLILHVVSWQWTKGLGKADHYRSWVFIATQPGSLVPDIAHLWRESSLPCLLAVLLSWGGEGNLQMSLLGWSSSQELCLLPSVLAFLKVASCIRYALRSTRISVLPSDIQLTWLWSEDSFLIVYEDQQDSNSMALTLCFMFTAITRKPILSGTWRN